MRRLFIAVVILIGLPYLSVPILYIDEPIIPTPIMLATSIINETTTSQTATFHIATRANIALYELIGRYDNTFIAIPSIFIS